MVDAIKGPERRHHHRSVAASQRPTAVDARRGQTPLPTVEEFATAITHVALNSDVPETIYVGGADYLM